MATPLLWRLSGNFVAFCECRRHRRARIIRFTCAFLACRLLHAACCCFCCCYCVALTRIRLSDRATTTTMAVKTLAARIFFFFGCDFSSTCSASFCFYFFFLSRRNKHTQTHTHTCVHTLMYFHITEEIIQYAQFPTAFYISRASERAQRSRQTHASNVEKNQSEIPWPVYLTKLPPPLVPSPVAFCCCSYSSSCRTGPYSMGRLRNRCLNLVHVCAPFTGCAQLVFSN